MNKCLVDHGLVCPCDDRVSQVRFSFSISYFLCLSWFQSSYGLILDTVDFTLLTLDCGNSQLAISTTHMALSNNMHWLSDNKIEWLSVPWCRPNSSHRCISSPPALLPHLVAVTAWKRSKVKTCLIFVVASLLLFESRWISHVCDTMLASSSTKSAVSHAGLSFLAFKPLRFWGQRLK